MLPWYLFEKLIKTDYDAGVEKTRVTMRMKVLLWYIVKKLDRFKQNENEDNNKDDKNTGQRRLKVRQD